MHFRDISRLALSGALLLSSVAMATETAPKKIRLDPDKIVQQMCGYLNSLNQFSFRAEVTDDQVYSGGKKLQYTFDTETFVQRPDKLRVNARGDRLDKQFFFDGKALTLYDVAHQVYATAAFPGDIEGALEHADQKLGFRVALGDFASPKLCEHLAHGKTHALYVGASTVRGVPTAHLAFDRQDIQLQVWVASGPKPFPVKLLINQKNLKGSPQWTAYISDLNAKSKLEPATFLFKPTAGAQPIKFSPLRLKTPAQAAAQPTKTGEKP